MIEKLETITISKKVHDKLIEDSLWLQCLEAAGVDNWPGMEEAIRIQNDIKGVNYE